MVSEFAEYLGKETEKLTYIALSDNNVRDKEWQEKIYLHAKKTKDWILIETTDLLKILRKRMVNFDRLYRRFCYGKY